MALFGPHVFIIGMANYDYNLEKLEQITPYDNFVAGIRDEAAVHNNGGHDRVHFRYDTDHYVYNAFGTKVFDASHDDYDASLRFGCIASLMKIIAELLLLPVLWRTQNPILKLL